MDSLPSNQSKGDSKMGKYYDEQSKLLNRAERQKKAIERKIEELKDKLSKAELDYFIEGIKEYQRKQDERYQKLNDDFRAFFKHITVGKNITLMSKEGEVSGAVLSIDRELEVFQVATIEGDKINIFAELFDQVFGAILID